MWTNPKNKRLCTFQNASLCARMAHWDLHQRSIYFLKCFNRKLKKRISPSDQISDFGNYGIRCQTIIDEDFSGN